jgi:hypothetical protein
MSASYVTRSSIAKQETATNPSFSGFMSSDLFATTQKAGSATTPLFSTFSTAPSSSLFSTPTTSTSANFQFCIATIQARCQQSGRNPYGLFISSRCAACVVLETRSAPRRVRIYLCASSFPANVPQVKFLCGSSATCNQLCGDDHILCEDIFAPVWQTELKQDVFEWVDKLFKVIV